MEDPNRPGSIGAFSGEGNEGRNNLFHLFHKDSLQNETVTMLLKTSFNFTGYTLQKGQRTWHQLNVEALLITRGVAEPNLYKYNRTISKKNMKHINYDDI